MIVSNPTQSYTPRWSTPTGAPGAPGASEPQDRHAGTLDVAVATKILTGNEEVPSLVKLWEVDLGHNVTQLGVAPDGSVLANVSSGYFRLAAADGAQSPKIEHELLQSTPMPAADGSTYLVGSWGVARIEADGTQSWQKYLGSSVFNQPLATPDGGVVATPCSQGEVHRLDSQGELRWMCELEPKPCYGAEVKGPMAQDGLGRLLMSSQGQLYAVDFESGEKLWSKKLDAENIWFCNGPVVTPDNYILVNTDSTLQLLDPQGNTQWVWSGHSDQRIDQLPPESWDKKHLDRQAAPMSCQPAISTDGQALYGGGTATGNAQHNLVSLNRAGDVNWAINLNASLRVESIQVAPDGTVYAVGTSSEHNGDFKFKSFTEVHAVTPQGDKLWSFRTPTDSATASTRFAVDHNQVYLAAGGGKVYALRADALNKKCQEMTQGGQIGLGSGNFIVVGGVKVKVRKVLP